MVNYILAIRMDSIVNEIDSLRDQQNKEHPLLAAQNLLTGAGKPIMSPSQKQRVMEDLKYFRTSVRKTTKKKDVQCFINEAFEFDQNNCHNYKSVNL